MKYLKQFYPWVIVGTFLTVVFYWVFVSQKKASDKLSVCGEVVRIEEKRGGHYVIIREEYHYRYLSYTITNEMESDIHIGDSIFKSKNSPILYVKSAKDGKMRIADHQDYLLGE